MSVALAAPWLTDSGLTNHFLIKRLMAGLCAGVLLTLTLWRFPYKPLVYVHISWIKSCFLLLFVLGAASLLWSVNADFTISKWLLWLIGFSTFITAYHLRPDQQLLYGFCWGLLGFAGIIAIVGVLQHWWDIVTLVQYAPPASTFGNRNMATHVIVLTLPIGLFLLSAKNISLLQTWLVAITITIIMAYIAYTQTRSAWVAVISQVMVIGGFLYFYRQHLQQYIYWHPGKTIACWVSFCLLFLLLNVGKSGWEFFLFGALEQINRVASVNARLDIWAMTITMIMDNPIFGSGLGSWYHNEVQEGYGRARGMIYVRAHNDLLELMAELGLTGVFLFLAGVISITVAVLVILKKHAPKAKNVVKDKQGINNESDMRLHTHIAWFYFLVWVALVGSFIQMLFTFPYQEPVPIFVSGLYLGLIARYSEAVVPAIKTLIVPISKSVYWAACGLAFIAIVLSLLVYADWFRNNQAMSRMVTTSDITKTPFASPYINSHYYQSNLRTMAAKYIDDHHSIRYIESHALNYWPNNFHAMENLLNAVLYLKDYEKAWEIIKHQKVLGDAEYYNDDLAELILYKDTGENKKFIDKFVNLLAEDEVLLAQQASAYRNLFKLSLHDSELMKYSEQLYSKSSHYHGYDCDSENNIAWYYWSKGSYAKAVEHLAIIKNSSDSSCLNPAWDELLKQHHVAILLDQAKLN